MNEWARVLRAVDVPGSAGTLDLAEVVALGLDVAPSSVGCSITTQVGEGFATPAATGHLALALDAAQYQSGSGPCVAAAQDGRVHDVDMAEEPGAYGEFVLAAREHAVATSLSWPMPTAPRPAALNLYASTAGAFAEPRARAVAALLARVLAAVMGATPDPDGQLEWRVEQVSRDRLLVVSARDDLAAQHGLTAEEAFELLARSSARQGRRLVEVAGAILAGPGDIGSAR